MALVFPHRKKQFSEALRTLEEVIVLYKIGDNIIRDSMIQRFEYTVEAFWKMLKSYLHEEKGVESTTPKSIIRECRNTGLLSEEEVELALNMIDDRNVSSHAYAISLAMKIARNIPPYAKLLKIVETRLS
jgi:nucleotidyltransferase substrate binding protein (TIGR01987 family)